MNSIANNHPKPKPKIPKPAPKSKKPKPTPKQPKTSIAKLHTKASPTYSRTIASLSESEQKIPSICENRKLVAVTLLKPI